MRIRIRIVAWLALLAVCVTALHPLMHPGEWRGLPLPAARTHIANILRSEPAAANSGANSRPGKSPEQQMPCPLGLLAERIDTHSAQPPALDLSFDATGRILPLDQELRQQESIFDRPGRAPPRTSYHPC